MLREILPNDAKLLDFHKRNRITTDEKKARGQFFFNNDYISCDTLGISDFVSTKNSKTGKREHFQKRYMHITIGKAFQIYIREIDKKDQVCKSDFYKMRPKNVCCAYETPHNVCICQQHAKY